MEKIKQYNFNDYCCIDLETTGLSPTYDKITEIAILKIRDGLIIDNFCTLIDPEIKISPFITKKTNITNEMVYNKPKIYDIADKIIEFLGNDIIIGYSVNFDINFLNSALLSFKNYLIENNLIDCLALAKDYCECSIDYKLDNICVQLKINKSTSHRALADASATYELFELLKLQTKTEILHNYLYNNNNLNSKTKKHNRKYLCIKDIAATVEISNDNIDYDFNNKVFVFTGELKELTREDAYRKVIEGGGKVISSVSKNVDVLVNAGDSISTKFKKALELQSAGFPINIITDEIFMKMLLNKNAIN